MAGEMIAVAVVKEVVGRLASFVEEEIQLQWNFKKDLQHMYDTLSMLVAVLGDAEKRSYTDAAIKLWLKKLKYAAYDIQDMLNEFRNTIPRHQEFGVQDDIPSKVLGFVSSIPLIARETMAHKMKEMRKRLDRIVELKTKYNIQAGDPKSEFVINARKTYSLVDKDIVYGRDDEMELIVKMVLDRSTKERIAVIPLVGIGGIGKTTLAQLVYNDDRVKKQFELKLWVYVSMNFDLTKVGQSIIACATDDQCHIDILEVIASRLKIILSEKKYLLVLDDYWNEAQEDWRKLMLMLNFGSSESKIIITTRNSAVAKMASTVKQHRLEYLSDEDCWKIFKNRAFDSEDDEKEHPNLVRIGKEIIKKCGGVPLAAISVGGLLNNNKGKNFWLSVRDNHSWKSDNGDDNISEILPSLKLTYSYMTPELKLCFSYCSIFPKGSDIDCAKLVKQWIALGFIRSAKGISAAMEIGEQHLKSLLSLSFLQDYKWHEKTCRFVCKMHDLVHDLAIFVAGDEVIIANVDDITHKDVGTCRYATVMAQDRLSNKNFAKLNRVRALSFTKFYVTELPKHIFSWVPRLHVLDVSRCILLDDIPSSLNKLKQLRYLDASNINIDKFPYAILPHLVFLDLANCGLRSLPESISYLPSLYSLNISGCQLKTLPPAIGELQNLEYLDCSDSGLETLPESIGNIQKLKYLNLSYCQLKILPETICNISALCALNLSCCFYLQTLPPSIGSLKCLQSLNLSSCKLENIPESIGDLQDLHSLDLSKCEYLQKIPESIGNLRNLHSLNLFECEYLQIIPESTGNLQNLHSLNLSSCYKLQKVPESIGNLQNLSSLDLSRCYRLQKIPESIGNLQNLHSLDLYRCYNLQKIPESIGNLQKLFLLGLSLYNCTITTLPTSMRDLSSLEHLCIEGCGRLTELPEWLGELSLMKSIVIFGAAKLEFLPQSLQKLTNLHRLYLHGCHSILHNRYRRGGSDWRNVAHIADLHIDEEEE